MARFPYYQNNVKDLGRLLAQASVDPEFYSMLHADPQAALAEIGLPEETVALISFKIVKAETDARSITLPYRVDKTKIRGRDLAYLSDISKALSGHGPN
ncbi:hypothetical protein GCM10011316_15600 [Roseibium aquae]|uniref:Uncharacterized protein n=1 Tax=Roseibium aquae TaxID=1323746 RepID=A0A916TH22_9HYPH|nr:hypothetical protein [Roseibium aquae]GGB44462.1 hypothetical protein GCM10011316_15600 [Roseibium aquae]